MYFKVHDKVEDALVEANSNGRLTRIVDMMDLTWSNGTIYDEMITHCIETLGVDAIVPVLEDADGKSVWPLRYPYDPTGIWSHNVGTFYFDIEEDAVLFRLKFS